MFISNAQIHTHLFKNMFELRIEFNILLSLEYSLQKSTCFVCLNMSALHRMLSELRENFVLKSCISQH